jgi:MFS family permease
MGLLMALQFGPALLFLPVVGSAADHFNRRKLLMVTQSAMGLLAFVLGALTVTGAVQLWQVYALAFAQGTVSAFDAPTRQAFFTEMVDDEDLPNAVALNSASFNAARLVGPAVAGVAIAVLGTGWAFIFNGVSFGAVLLVLCLLRTSELRPSAPARRGKSGFVEGLRYVRDRPDLRTILVMMFLFGVFGINLALVASIMAVTVFHADSRAFGLLSSIMAVGALAGSLIAAAFRKVDFGSLVLGSVMFGVSCMLGALSTGYWVFAGALVIAGIAAMIFSNAVNSLLQLNAEPSMRGRVSALRLALADGSTPIGAPIIGWLAEQFGPRWALGAGAVAGLVVAGLAAAFLALSRSPGRSEQRVQ